MWDHCRTRRISHQLNPFNGRVREWEGERGQNGQLFEEWKRISAQTTFLSLFQTHNSAACNLNSVISQSLLLLSGSALTQCVKCHVGLLAMQAEIQSGTTKICAVILGLCRQKGAGPIISGLKAKVEIYKISIEWSGPAVIHIS